MPRKSFLPESVYVIAEAGVNHNGDVRMALRLIDAAADAGANAVKFQLFDPEEIASATSPLAAYQKASGERSQQDMLRSLILPRDAYQRLAEHARTRGIDFIVTPFDIASAKFIATLGVPAIKIPSGEVTNLPFLESVSKLGLPVILSTGTCSLEEVTEAVSMFSDVPLALLHCTSAYPTPYDQVNLRVMATLRERFRVPVGLSDHTEGIAIPIAAAALGAQIIEKHFTLDRSLPGPDHKASIEPQELSAMVTSIRNVEEALGVPEKRRQPSEEDTARVARRSVVAAVNIAAGEKLTKEKLAIKRPGTGIPPKELPNVVGRKVKVDVTAGMPLTHEMLQ